MFDWEQMEQLRLGLEHDVDVSVYANPKFSDWQMEEIREGLESGVDASTYADPEFIQREIMQAEQDHYDPWEALEEEFDPNRRENYDPYDNFDHDADDFDDDSDDD